MELQQCKHQQLISSSCRLCGSYHSGQSQVAGMKTKRWSSPFGGDNCQVLKSMQRRSLAFLPIDQPPNNTNLNEFVADIVGKFKFSLETHALGLYFFYGVVMRRTTHSYNQLLYASVCLLVAAKSVQRQQQIPKLSVLKKGACNYLPQQQYSQAERTILQLLDYNVEVCTFMTFLHYYLCNGVIFSSDGKEAYDVARLENSILAKSTELIRSGRFLSYKPERLAAWVVFTSRQQLKLPGWNQHLQKVSGLPAQTLHQIVKQLQPLNKPQVIPLQFHSINIIKVKELMPQAKKLGSTVRQVTHHTAQNCRRNLLTVITNDNTSLRDFKSLNVMRRC